MITRRNTNKNTPSPCGEGWGGVLLLLLLFSCQTFAQETIWFQHNDRFTALEEYSLEDIDSVEFTKAGLKRWKTNASTGKATGTTKTYFTDGAYYLQFPGRTLSKPSGYSNCDYTKESSQWCFQRSMESEHFICFWEKGLTKSGNTVSGVNIKTLLNNAEKIWTVYVDQLGFLEPGNSLTDRTKIHMYIVNQSEWRADGSGQDGTETYYSGTTKASRPLKVGLFHCNPAAAGARGGHTPAHEIGHVFQYLVSADLGDSHGLNYGYGGNRWSGNCFWEDCANWQAYKVYPDMQFSDGEYYEQYMGSHHLNILHEDARYKNCFYHDYWCMKHGQNTIGRIWRESTYPEDPVEAYMRLFGLSLDEFSAEMYEGFARMATWDIDGVRDRAKHRIGSYPQRLVEPSADIVEQFLGGEQNKWWTVSPNFCPQNFGYNINALNVPAAGTVVRATFRGIVGAPGFRKVNADRAGWRYGLVAYTKTGERLYGQMQSDATDGVAEITVPEDCTGLWFVVMGAPSKYWQHQWDDNHDNDEQWPYAVKFDGTDALGALRTYGEFPDDHERRDTTVVLTAKLPQDSWNYSSVNVQYDMNAISEALGLSTAQLKTLKRNDATSNKGDIRFAGVNKDGKTMTWNTTTSTSSDQCYGHWFTTAGNVCGYDNSAAIFAELYPDSYICKVGQYPGHLTKGKTYVIRQAVVYTHTDGKQYKAIIEVHLEVI